MDLNIEISKDGYKIQKIIIDGKSKYIGSKYNQERQINAFINNLGEITRKDNFVIFGLGFCEHIRKVLEITNFYNKILIIEQNNDLIYYCKNDEKVNEILKDKRIIILKNILDIKKFFDKYINEGNINFLKISSYCNNLNLFWDNYINLYDEIKNEMSKIILKRNTVISNGNLYLKNFLCNLAYIAKNPGVNCLENKYKDKPAVIVSAGPSLNKNIDLLKYVNNSLILTGARTLNALINKNVNISCMGVIDPNDVSYELIKECIDTIEVPLFFNDFTPNKILRHHKGKKIFALQNNNIKKVLQKDIPSLYGGGSIAHSLTNLALYMGCNPIVFVGQDLAYTNDKKHDKLAENDIDNKNIEEKDFIYTKDIYGKTVKTSFELNVYRKNFEDIIRSNPQTIFINATEGGINIQGALNKQLKDVINEFRFDNIDSICSYLTEENNSNRIHLYLEKTLSEFIKFLKLCKNELEIIDNIETESNLKAIEDNIDIKYSEILKNICNIEILNPELSQLIYQIEGKKEFVELINDSDEIAFNKKIQKIKKLCLGFIEVIEKNYNTIKIIMKELEN